LIYLLLIGSFRCIRKTTTSTTTTTTTTTRKPEIRYATTQQPNCPNGFERNYLGACIGELLLIKQDNKMFAVLGEILHFFLDVCSAF